MNMNSTVYCVCVMECTTKALASLTVSVHAVAMSHQPYSII